MPQPTFVMLVLAAGTSSRMGTPKAALRLHGRPLLELHVSVYGKMGLRSIYVVLGHNADLLRSQLELSRAHVVLNHLFELGQFSSVQAGLRALNGTSPGGSAPRGVFITPVDCPPVPPKVVTALLERFEGTPPPAALIPTYIRRPGHPVLLGRQAIAAALRADTSSSLAKVLQELGKSVQFVETDEPSILVNLNTPQDIEQYSNRDHSR